MKYLTILILIIMTSCGGSNSLLVKKLNQFNLTDFKEEHLILKRDDTYTFSSKNDSIRVKQRIKLTGLLNKNRSEHMDFYFSEGMEEIEFIKLDIWKKSDSKKMKFRLSGISDVRGDSFYDGLKRIELKFPFVNDTLIYEVEYEINYINPNISKPIYLVNDIRIKDYQVNLKNFTNDTLLIFETGYISNNKFKLENEYLSPKDSIVLNIGEIEDDKKLTKYEVIYPYIRQVHFSLKNQNYVHDWKSFSHYFYNLNKENYIISDSLFNQIKNDIKDTGISEKLVEEVFNYVQRKVRYEAFENGVRAFKSDKPDLVFKNKYADCKGVTYSIVAILNRFNIKAYPALLCGGDSYFNLEKPKLGMANHVVAVVDLGMKRYWLDATGNFNSYQHPSYFIEGKNTLIVKSENDFEYTKVPKINRDFHKMKWDVNAKLKKNDLDGEMNVEFSGSKADEMRSLLLDYKSSDRNEQMKNYIKYFLDAATISDFTIKNLNKLEENLIVTFKFQKKDILSRFRDKSILSISFLKKLSEPYFKINTDSAIQVLSIDKSVELNLNIKLDTEPKQIELPKKIFVDNDNLFLSSHYQNKKNSLIINTKRIIKKNILLENQLDQFREEFQNSHQYFEPTVSWMEKQ
jgi:hypothetical protein